MSRLRITLAGLPLVLLAAGCGSDAEPARGELMLVLGTDMAVPDGIERVSAVVLRGPEVLARRDYELAPVGTVTLPGTLAIVAGPSTPAVTIEVTGFGPDATGTTVARTFGKVVTEVPKARMAMLRMPVEWLCDGSALTFGEDQFTSSCDADADGERACVAGSCSPVALAEAELDDYDPAAVFGGGTSPSDPVARCFDVAACFVTDRRVTADADCSLDPLADDGTLNFGLRVSPEEGGICDAAATPRCTVPLDRDELRGWWLRDDGRIQLPPAVCERVTNGRAKIVITDFCESKTAAYPTCGPWSSVDR